MIAVQPITRTDLLRHDIVPVLTGYVVFLAIVASYWLHRRAGKPTLARGGGTATGGATDEHRYAWRPLARYLAGLFVGGYAFFLSVVVIFYFVIGERSRTFISQALGQGSVFTFGIVLPAFMVLSFAEDGISRMLQRRRDRERRSAAHPGS
jgi:hypothetical protein